jgi:hypothetical protein
LSLIKLHWKLASSPVLRRREIADGWAIYGRLF